MFDLNPLSYRLHGKSMPGGMDHTMAVSAKQRPILDFDDLATARGTLWGAVNAVTYYTDHVRSTKTAERIDSAWFGSGAALKALAWLRAEELLEQSAAR